MPDKKRDENEAETRQDGKRARPLIVHDQTSFVDEETRTGKHFTSSRKVTDLDRVGAMAPDADPEPDSEAPKKP
jgi:hypothetical protein